MKKSLKELLGTSKAPKKRSVKKSALGSMLEKKERGGHAHLRIIPVKEIMTKAFTKKALKDWDNRFHDILTTAGNYDHDNKKATDAGVAAIKRVVGSYIENKMDMGANIASQSVQKLTNEDWQKVYDNFKEMYLSNNYAEGGNLNIVPEPVSALGDMAKGGSVKKMPEIGSPEWHKIQVAKKTMRYSDAGASVMGGQTKEEAKKILDQYSIKYEAGGSLNIVPEPVSALGDMAEGGSVRKELKYFIKDELSGEYYCVPMTEKDRHSDEMIAGPNDFPYWDDDIKEAHKFDSRHQAENELSMNDLTFDETRKPIIVSESVGNPMAEGGIVNHGFKVGDTVLEIYKGYGIIKDKMGVISVVDTAKGERFPVLPGDGDVDEAKKEINKMPELESFAKGGEVDDQEEYLNNHYSENMSEDEAVDQLIYLTNKNRGKYITMNTLRAAYHNGTMGSLLKKYDPIAFNTSRSDNYAKGGDIRSRTVTEALEELENQDQEKGDPRVGKTGKQLYEQSKYWIKGNRKKYSNTGISPIVMRAMTETVTDIGQLTPGEIKDLEKYVKLGILVKGPGGPYPKPKTVYAIKGFDIAAERKELVDQMMKLSDLDAERLGWNKDKKASDGAIIVTNSHSDAWQGEPIGNNGVTQPIFAAGGVANLVSQPTSMFEKGGTMNKKYTYYDSVAGKQKEEFDSLGAIVKHIEDFPYDGYSYGTVYQGETPILEYNRYEGGLVWAKAERKSGGMSQMERGGMSGSRYERGGMSRYERGGGVSRLEDGGMAAPVAMASNQPVLPDNITSTSFKDGGRIPNEGADKYSQLKMPFTGHQMEGRMIDGGNYVVLDRGFYPLWFFSNKENKWYGNETKHNEIEAFHQAQSRPCWDAIMLPHDKLTIKMKEAEAAHYDLGGIMARQLYPMTTDNTTIAHSGAANTEM